MRPKDGIVVVTGAAGFIGSAVVRYLNDKGISKLLLVDDLKTSDKWKNLVGKAFIDLISKHALFDWLREHKTAVSSIIHLGACSDTTERDGDYLLENNFHYTRRLAEFALKYEKRFIYASSAATYGDGSLGFCDDLSQLEELRPLNLYGWSKHLFDLWAKREGVFNQIVGLKYFNVFGPNEAHKSHMASMVYKMYPKVVEEGLIRLFRSNDSAYQDGEQMRDFIYIKDVVRMTCDFLNHSVCGLFNIGSGVPTSWNRLAHDLFSAAGKPARIEYIDMPPQLKGQYQNYTCADMTKYCQAVGISGVGQPTVYNMTDSVNDYVENYLKQDRRW